MSDFSENTGNSTGRKYTVGEINSYIKRMFDQDFLLERVTVTGEISGCKNGARHQTGHIYFNLKDDSGIIPAVIWKSSRDRIDFDMKDGDKVEVYGKISVYEPYGKYQLYVTGIKKAGAGELFERFQELKKRLEAEGYYDPAHKKPIPKFIKRLGVITAATGAAVRDIINVTHRRNPGVDIFVYPAVVQGDGAAPTLIEGIQTLDMIGVDTIIIGRGGGSIEDLWAFNEPSVAMAIYNCETPILSAVGHEVDFSISDFVADLRAATPSAAAEIAVFDLYTYRRALADRLKTMNNLMVSRLSSSERRCDNLALRLENGSPARKLSLMDSKIDALRQSMDHSMEKLITSREERLKRLLAGFIHKMDLRIERDEEKLLRLAEVINANAPLKKITGGFALVTKDDGSRLENITDVSKSDKLTLMMHDGVVKTRVEEVWPAETPFGSISTED